MTEWHVGARLNRLNSCYEWFVENDEGDREVVAWFNAEVLNGPDGEWLKNSREFADWSTRALWLCATEADRRNRTETG